MRSSTELQRQLALLRRRRARGAAFVESLIVISLILLVLYAVLWLHGLYSAKLATLQSARVQAWTDALQGCPPPELADRAAQTTSNADTGPSGGPEDNSGDFAGLRADTQDNGPDWFNLLEGGEGSASLDYPSFTGRGRSYQVGARRSFMCNEQGGMDQLEFSGSRLRDSARNTIRDLFR